MLKGGSNMNKTIVKVFMIIGILVAVFLAWQLIFNDGGILKTGYNSIANLINSKWAQVAGSGQKILALWGTNAADNGTAFDIGTGSSP